MRDLADVEAMLGRGLIEPAELLRLGRAIEGDLFRYPAIDAATFVGTVDRFISARPS